MIYKRIFYLFVFIVFIIVINNHEGFTNLDSPRQEYINFISKSIPNNIIVSKGKEIQGNANNSSLERLYLHTGEDLYRNQNKWLFNYANIKNKYVL